VAAVLSFRNLLNGVGCGGKGSDRAGFFLVQSILKIAPAPLTNVAVPAWTYLVLPEKSVEVY
jgi:hypothetical protein